jgi:hypothetical protein
LYKEDFTEFNAILAEMTDYIITEKGLEVISERHQKDYVKEEFTTEDSKDEASADNFTDVSFDDI